MKEKYYRVKGMYKDFLVFIKSGNFWNVFYGDAVILHYVTGYKISNNKLVFPLKVLDKLLSQVSKLNISYVLVYALDDIRIHDYSSNSYAFYLDKFRNVYDDELKLKKSVSKMLNKSWVIATILMEMKYEEVNIIM